jgi:(2Fe-2S) ferredoxin
MEIIDVCEKGETVSISFHGTVWYTSLTFSSADLRKLAKLLQQGNLQLQSYIKKKETVRELTREVRSSAKEAKT